MVISFEGNEGSGKTTALRSISEYLTAKGIKHVLLREPGSNKIAEQIRNIILDKNNSALDDTTEMLLYIAARRQNLVETIIPELKKGNIVLLDRFYDSTYAYQVSGRGLDKEFCDILHSYIFKDFSINKTFYFDISYKEGMKRVVKNNRDTNRMDEQAKDFYIRVEDGYKKRIVEDPNRFVIIDARLSVEKVCEQCIKKLEQIINI